MRKRSRLKTLRQLRVPSQLKNEKFWARASLFELIYSVGGLIVGVLAIFGGIVLTVAGVAGNTNWTVNVLGLQSELSDAAPGIVIMLVGFFIIFVTRLKIQSGK